MNLRNPKESLIRELAQGWIKTPADLAQIKRRISKKYKIPCPSNINLLKIYREMVRSGKMKKSRRIENLLRTRPIRSLSGIVNISVLTKPYPCPGKCLYCPIESGIPKSYVSGEPAVERAKRLNYNPYLQVKKRIEMLEAEGHPTDKIELRIVGGTWSYYPKRYQTWFIKRCFGACNSFGDFGHTTSIWTSYVQNEMAKHRIVGLSIETRPDYITESEIKRLRRLGVTMVELGVQSIYDDVLKLNLRGHGIKETILATKLLKDAGFKVLYQMMPNLPGSNVRRDLKMFGELFSDARFRPDLLKIYPCAPLKEAPLYKWYKLGKYKPYTNIQLISLIKSIKKKIPYYVRIQRIIRDIPSQKILAGAAKISNLRQVLAEKSKRECWKCKCIRCREVRENYNPEEKLYLFRQDYDASDGKEIFLSFENKDQTKLYSLLRLRIAKARESEGGLRICNGVRPRFTAIIRDVHTYGQLHPLNYRGATPVISPQHKGLGKKLIKEAEKITKKEFGLNKISVISGIGVRDYWRKLSYKLKDTYMVKKI